MTVEEAFAKFIEDLADVGKGFCQRDQLLLAQYMLKFTTQMLQENKS
jgi:hypothetical protein